VLHWWRKRMNEIVLKESQGVSFWSDKFDENTRVRLLYAYRDAAEQYNLGVPTASARDLLLREKGVFFLVQSGLESSEDFFRYVMECSDDMMPSVVEAMSHGCASINTWGRHAYASFERSVEVIFRNDRISYELINQEMVEFSSKELHSSIVSPTLTLLADPQGLGKVERAYQDALKEISNGNPGNAITDAGTALQELLETLGCDGNSLGPLIKSARKMDLIAAHDVRMLDGIEKIMHWVSADRSELGDAHKSTDASVNDAWLIVHIVGALILRLAQGNKRLTN
jgi:hypothetical protein